VSCHPYNVVTYANLKVISADAALIYCDLISPQFLDSQHIRDLRTFIQPSTYCKHTFDNIYYVPVEKRRIQDIEIKILRLEGTPVKITVSDVPVKIRATFSTRFPLAINITANVAPYSVHNEEPAGTLLSCSGWSRCPSRGIGPVYSVHPFVQRGHGIGSFLRNLFRLVRPVIWSGVKAVGKESLRTGTKILTDIADTDRRPRDIITSHVGDSAQNLIQKLRGRGGKRSAPLRRIPAKKTKKPKLTKRDIFS
jgi:hypothetical protein